MLTLQFDGLYREVPANVTPPASNRSLSGSRHIANQSSTDGSAAFMCYGWVILRDGVVIAKGHGGYVRGRDASSNVAEYLALIEGLEALIDMGAERELICIGGDAKSVIEQMEGEASVSAESIKPLYRRARKLIQQFRHIYWNWAPRRYNHEADALTRRALRQLIANPETYADVLLALKKNRNKRKESLRLMPVLDLRIYRAI